MNQNTLIWAILVPPTKRACNLSELHEIVFNADRVNDVLKLTCVGTDKATGGVVTVVMKDKVLSENMDYVNIFDAKIKDAGLKYRQIDVSILNVDFVKKTLSTTVYYIMLNGERDSVIIPLVY